MAKKWRDLYERTFSSEEREEIDREVQQELAKMPLHEVRRARELSQEHLARTMNQNQSAISRLERRADMYVSTLRNYIRAMGGELEIVARFPDGSVCIDQFADIDRLQASPPG
jgi:ribosome-binding protein aMBF1 (putative translation factor)